MKEKRNTLFSHGICDPCIQLHYPDFYDQRPHSNHQEPNADKCPAVMPPPPNLMDEEEFVGGEEGLGQ